MKILYWQTCILSLCFLCTIWANAFSQENPTALVTDIIHEVKLYSKWRSVLNDESFPNYFETDSIWANLLKEQVKQLVQEKVNVDEVHIEPKAIQFRLSVYGGLPELQLTNTRPDQANYRVAIIGQLNIAHISVDPLQQPMKNYQYTCQVKILDQANTTTFAHSVSIPLSVAIPTDAIHGPAELSKEDVQGLFTEAVRAAFTGQTRLAKRTFYRPSYQDASVGNFIKSASLYQLREIVNKGVPVRKGEARKTVMELNEIGGNHTEQITAQQTFISNGNSSSGKFISHATLYNPLTRMEYELTATFDRPVMEDSLGNRLPSTSDPLVAVRCTSRRLLLGDFTLTNKTFEGMVGYEVYTITRIAPKNTYELRVNNKLKAIIQKSGTERTTNAQNYLIAFPEKANTAEKGNLLTVYLIYKTAYEFGHDYLLF